ncbi:MAG: helix-turn-helix transcriptional regulator [Oscillibacter sp.]|nr:helix-turn-helix transcriptional regulator [Oscillibacter sp.]
MAFSENLQYIRSRDHVTQEQLAEQLDVSRQSVSKWESGASFPEMDTLLRLCELYHVDLDTLLRGSVEEIDVADTAGYDRFMNRFSWKISLSIAAIIAGVSMMLLLQIFGVHEMLASALFLLVVTISVVVLVASGIQHEHFCKRHPVISDFYTDDEKDRFHQKFIWLIAGGVGAVLFGVVLMLLFFSFFPEQEPYETIVCSLFLLIIACAVLAFIYAGLQNEKYQIWKYNRDNSPTPEAKKRLDLIGTICGCLMLLATAVYVGLGFTNGSWGTTWWVFPVGGILCAVVNVALDPYRD